MCINKHKCLQRRWWAGGRQLHSCLQCAACFDLCSFGIILPAPAWEHVQKRSTGGENFTANEHLPSQNLNKWQFTLIFSSFCDSRILLWLFCFNGFVFVLRDNFGQFLWVVYSLPVNEFFFFSFFVVVSIISLLHRISQQTGSNQWKLSRCCFIVYFNHSLNHLVLRVLWNLKISYTGSQPTVQPRLWM